MEFEIMHFEFDKINIIDSLNSTFISNMRILIFDIMVMAVQIDRLFLTGLNFYVPLNNVFKSADTISINNIFVLNN
jgi:hypothetical protein